MRRILTFALLLMAIMGIARSVDAAVLSQRSPVRLGLWWDPAHDGSGFEFFRGGDEVALLWYTYRADGAPTWYTASARFTKEGTWSAPLYRHRWADGGAAEAVAVGRVTLQRHHHERLSLTWAIDERSGVQELQPYPLGGVVAEVDHSGAWFDPQRPGFGLTLTEQGESLVAGLYFYDAEGQPTWRLGSNGGHGRALTLSGFSGACPGCPRRSLTVRDSSTLDLQFDSETALRARYVGGLGAAWPLDGALEQLSLPASKRAADRQLAAFDHAQTLREYLDAALVDARVEYPPAVDFSPAPATVAFSPTNVQEAGVDEADRLKSDGAWLYAIAKDEAMHDRAAVRVAEVRGDGAEVVARGEVGLTSSESRIEHSGLYLTPERLVALQGSSPHAYVGQPLWMQSGSWGNGSTRVTLFDRSTPAAPSVLWKGEFDGHLVASRRIGQRLYLVLRKTTEVPGIGYGATPDAVRGRLAQLTLDDLLPRVRTGTGDWRALVDAVDVHMPVVAGLTPTPQFVTVAAINLDAPDEIDALAVLGTVSAVYVSPQRMYLATARADYLHDEVLGFHPGGYRVTDVHEIALGDEGPTFAASGTLEGFLDREPDRAAFRFSERDGRLRVVTVGGAWDALGQNRVTVLERSSIAPGLLRTLSYLPNRNRPAPLGKPNEILYGTRFVGDRLYAVTFLSTDPLYVVDLADPADPKIAGELVLPGFSDYLHPVGEKLLVGIGLDAKPAINTWGDGQFAWFQGLLFSLFDVSDPARPRVLQQAHLGKRGSASAILRSHHALSVLPGADATGFALPVRVHDADGSEPPTPPDSHYYPWSWSGVQKFSVTSREPASARLVAGPALATHRRSATLRDVAVDDAREGARSIQFARGIVYVENGRFWRADSDGSVLQGPF